MRIAVHDHQHKAFHIVQALVAMGHELVVEPPADLMLMDQDSLPYYRKIIDGFAPAPVIVYPHGAMSYICWDGIWDVGERTIGMLVMGEGAAEVARGYGYPRPVKAIGWAYGERGMFEAKDLASVLFAPIHPLNNGTIYGPARDANAAAFEALLKTGVPLTVRFVGDLKAQGLWVESSVQYIDADMSVLRADTERPSVVVGHDTFAYCAAARGIPTVMMGQDLAPWATNAAADFCLVKHWDAYKDAVRFPLDADDGELLYVLQRACQSYDGTLNWKHRFLGPEMTPATLGKAIEELMQ